MEMPQINNNALDRLFSPRNIAVVGASTDQTKLGTAILKNIIYAGFKGDIYPINPKYNSVLGLKCYPAVSSIATTIDLAVIVVPAPFVLEIIQDCARAGVKNAVIISSGFKETGKQGAQIEELIVKAAHEYGMRILGPNCLGISSSKSKLDASFAGQQLLPGDIAFMSQSGAFNCALLDASKKIGLGFAHLVSFGNKSDLDENEMLKYWLNDSKVKVIGGYIEQFSNGREFIEIIKSNPSKPIVILHPGHTKESRKAAVSHTGSMADSSKVVQAALTQHGVIQVETVEEMFNTLMMLSWSDLESVNQADDIAIITNAGGPGIMLTDQVVSAGLKIAKLSKRNKLGLSKLLPEAASVNNPIDLIGDALADRYESTLKYLGKKLDNSVESIIALLTPQRVTQIEKTASVIANEYKVSDKFIVPVFMGGELTDKGLAKLWGKKVPAFSSSHEAIQAMVNLNQYLNYKRTVGTQTSSINLKTTLKPNRKFFTDQKKEFLRSHFVALINERISSKAAALPEDISKALVSQFGFDLPAEAIVDTLEEAKTFATKVGYPVVIKATTEDVAHKTDFKALFLNISDVHTLEKSYAQLQKNLKAHTGRKSHRILIQEQITGGHELLIGVSRDGDSSVYNRSSESPLHKSRNGFGHVILFGYGGIYTEVFKDNSSRLLPTTRRQLSEMINETKVSQIIEGARGKTPLALEQLIETLELLQEMVLLFPEIESIDINPVILTEKRCICVDFKIFIKQ